MTAESIPVHLANAWHEVIASPEHWCTCGEYRVRSAGDLCPVCADEKRRASECSTCSGSGVLEDWDGEHEWCPVCDSTGVAS